jgi:hypothetical protein
MGSWGDRVKFLPISLSPALPIFFFREGVKDHTGNHTQEADEEREVIGLSWISLIDLGEGFDDLS